MLKKRPVNSESAELNTFGGRLAEERKKLNLSQADLMARTRVSKSTQIKYEGGASFPDAEYLMALDRMGMDVMYILTGLRSCEAMTDEHQNLIDAYVDAPAVLKRAAFAVLLSPYVSEYKNVQEIPGYHRYELKGEADARYEDYLNKKND